MLVTGASGFIGGRLLPRLGEAGVRTVAVSRRPPQSPDSPHAEWRRCDMEDRGAVAGLFEEVRPECVIHLASAVTGSRDLAIVLPTFQANLAAAVHVLEAACRTGCRRVVLAGSMEELPLDQPARYPYAVAKRAAAEYGRFFHSLYGLEVVTARIGMVYGPGGRDGNKLVPHVILSQLAGRAPRLSSGRRRVDWVFVDDIADALHAAATTPGLTDAVVELGTGVATSIAEVAARLTALTGGPPPELGALPDRPNDVDIVMDAEGTARAMGWRARVGLDEGLGRTIDWYRDERAAGRM
jgi:UDP-glucose 4-epimerase